MSAFREIRRTMTEARESGEIKDDDAMADAYERRLLLVPEHNFGLSVGQYLSGVRSENGNWSNPLVRLALSCLSLFSSSLLAVPCCHEPI